MKKKKCNKKRKRDAGGKKKWQVDQENYYNRLLHGAMKDLKKQAKVVRTFECQKSVRKMKDRKPTTKEGGLAGINSQNGSSTEETYERLKNFDLDRIVQESLRRLGILHLNPTFAEEALKDKEAENDDKDDSASSSDEPDNDKDSSNDDKDADREKNEHDSSTDDDDKNDDAAAAAAADDDDDDTDMDKEKVDLSKENERLLEKILKHKKMQSTLEKWNKQVTDYRRWSLQQQDRDAPNFGYESKHIGKKTKSKANDRQLSATDINDDPEKSLFLRLDGGEDKEPQEDYQYGPGSYVVEEKKKNRKGQRARRAKAMAIEAKKAGRVRRPDDSLNWRPKKQYKPVEEEDNSGYRNNSQRHDSAGDSSQPARAKPAPAPAEKLHPSWAAAKKDTSGIVKFQGTKITF